MSKIILIIEDEHEIAEVYQELLTSIGYTTKLALDGEEGMRMAVEEYWDLLLLDIMLPKKDGIDILQDIKKLESLKTRPIILLTNLGKDDIVDRCLQLGANSYLVKSNVDPQEVVDQVNRFFPNA